MRDRERMKSRSVEREGRERGQDERKGEKDEKKKKTLNYPDQ